MKHLVTALMLGMALPAAANGNEAAPSSSGAYGSQPDTGHWASCSDVRYLSYYRRVREERMRLSRGAAWDYGSPPSWDYAPGSSWEYSAATGWDHNAEARWGYSGQQRW
jgi:hypothetical protein